jgi:hypothetical protein
LLGALANSRGHRHEENAAKLVNAALEMPKEVGAALLASAEGYTPRSTQLLEAARERLGTIQEVAGWIAESLPQPMTGPSRARRRRRRKKKGGPEGVTQTTGAQNGEAKKTETADGAPKKRRRRRKKPTEGAPSGNNGASSPTGDAPTKPTAPQPEAPQPAAAEAPAPAARAEDAA